jgi:hypothetical protein
MKPSNSEIEKYYFEKFRSQYVLPEGEIVYGDKPDIIIRGEKTVGIEITNLYIGANGGEQLSMRLNAVTRAQNYFKDKSGKNIEFSFGFNRKFPISGVAEFTEKLALLAERFKDSEIGTVPRNSFSDIPELSFVYRGCEYIDCEWQVSDTYSIPRMDKDRLVGVIRGKEKKAKEYAACDNLWLVVVIDCFNSAQDQEIMNAKLDGIESNIFTKVVIYKTGEEQIVEVPIKSQSN